MNLTPESSPDDFIVTFTAARLVTVPITLSTNTPFRSNGALLATAPAIDIPSSSVSTIDNTPNTPAATVPAGSPSAVMSVIVKNDPILTATPAFAPIKISVFPTPAASVPEM